MDFRFLRLVVAGLLLPLASLCGQAGELRRESVPSPTLGENLNFVVYVPDKYEATRVRYPVLYLLHGAGGDAGEWTNSAIQVQAVADKMIAAGDIPPALIVMPECRGCWWVDSPRANIETAFWADLVPGLAAKFRTIEAREGRAIGGYSAGGFGAVRFALKYPEKFAAVAAFSPAIYSDVPPAQSMARAQVPFKLANGGFNAGMWKARNYPALMEGYTRQAIRVPMFLVSGDHDKLGIAFETALLFKTMFELQADAVEFRVVDGGHSTEVAAKALPDALKFAFRYLQKPATFTAESHPPMASAAVR